MEGRWCLDCYGQRVLALEIELRQQALEEQREVDEAIKYGHEHDQWLRQLDGHVSEDEVDDEEDYGFWEGELVSEPLVTEDDLDLDDEPPPMVSYEESGGVWPDEY